METETERLRQYQYFSFEGFVVLCSAHRSCLISEPHGPMDKVPPRLKDFSRNVLRLYRDLLRVANQKGELSDAQCVVVQCLSLRTTRALQ